MKYPREEQRKLNLLKIEDSLVENLRRTDHLSLIHAPDIFPIVEKVIGYVKPFCFRIKICMVCCMTK